jgi:hypothetical protein
MREEKPSQASAPNHTASQHQTHQTAFLVPAALFTVLLALLLLVLLAPFTQKVGEQQLAEPSPAHNVATDQEASEAAFRVPAAFFAIALFILLASLAKQVGQ